MAGIGKVSAKHGRRQEPRITKGLSPVTHKDRKLVWQDATTRDEGRQGAHGFQGVWSNFDHHFGRLQTDQLTTNQRPSDKRFLPGSPFPMYKSNS